MLGYFVMYTLSFLYRFNNLASTFFQEMKHGNTVKSSKQDNWLFKDLTKYVD